MYKKLSLLIILLLPLAVFAQKISQTYNFKDFKIKKLDKYALVEFENCMQSGSPGQAMMPYKAVKLLLPPKTEAKSVKITFSNPKEITGEYILYPKQYVRPVSQGKSGTFIFDEAFYKSTNTVGEKDSYKVSTEYMNGHSVAFTHFTPLRYIPAKGKLYFYQTIKLELETSKNQKAQKAFAMYSGKQEIKKRIADYIDNPQMLSKYQGNNSVKSGDYEILIISQNQFESDFEDIRKLYLQRGMKSEFKDVNEIYGSMTGVDNPEKIRNYIIQEYQQHQIIHVVIAGDTEIVPYRGFYAYVQSSSDQEDNNIPSDLYYSALDGTWNDNGNGKWGEIGEDDLLPELSVARLPFSNSSELSKMLHKITMYQTAPVASELNKPLLAGEDLYNDPQTWGSDYLDLIIGFHDDNGYETTGIPEDSPYTTLYARDQSWGQSELLNELNSQGHPFIHHCGHSNTNYTMFLYNSDITNSNFSQINGTTHNYMLVYTHGCICGDFSADDCIAEEMVKIDNFAAGFVGNSRFGWFNEGQTEGPSAHIHREFIDALYDKKQNNIGMAHMISKYETAPWVNAPNQHEEGAIRWCFYDCNVLSDPTLPVWTDTPLDLQVNYDAALPLGTPYTITVNANGNPVENLNCVIIQNETLIGKAQTNENGTAQIDNFDPEIIPGPAQLIISGYNCLKTVYDINITNNDGPFITVSNYELNNNANNQIDNNEELRFNMTFENLGSEDATNCNSTISTEDEYLIPAYCSASLGTIPAGSSVFSENELCISTAAYVPDQYNAVFTVNTVCDQASWQKNIAVTINAPLLNITSFSILETSGNQNGILEAGETADFTLKIENTGHNISPECTIDLSNPDGKLNITSTAVNIGTLDAQSYENVVFSVTASDDMQIGSEYSLICNISASEYSRILQYNMLNQASEDFETGDFSSFNWQFGGSADWIISQNTSNTGTYSAVSGAIDNNESSVLEINLSVLNDGEISFYQKTSSEAGYDFLYFYIDDTKQGEWSGDTDWSKETFPVTAGTHSFKWEYKKDGLIYNFEDKVYIDDILFPAAGNVIEIPTSNNKLELKETQVSCYPNPFNTEISFEYNLDKNADVVLEIFNINGTLTDRINESQLAGQNSIICKKVAQLSPGIYIWHLKTDKGISSGKIIKTAY